MTDTTNTSLLDEDDEAAATSEAETTTDEETPTEESASGETALDEPVAEEEAAAEPEFDFTPIEASDASELLPEGYEASDEELAPLFEALNTGASRAEQARNVLALFAQHQQRSEELLAEAWETEQAKQKSLVEADPGIGGAKLGQTRATVRELIETHAGTAEEVAALKQDLALTGAGNRLSVIRLLSNLAKAIPGEATPVDGASVPTDKTRADKLFG